MKIPNLKFHIPNSKLAVLLGFLLPWRIEMAIMGRICLVSPFDIIWPFAAIWLLRELRSRVRQRPKCSIATAGAILGPIMFAASVTVHLPGASALPSFMILYAMTAGLFLANLDEVEKSSFIQGLAIGTVSQLAVSIPAGLFFPELIRDGAAFRGLYASKNGLAFLVGILGVRAIDSIRSFEKTSPLIPSLSREKRTSLLVAAGWFTVVMLTRSRAALLASLTSVMVSLSEILVRRKQRSNIAVALSIVVMIVALASGLVYRSEYLPSDRLEFATSIVRYADTIPFFGIGPGSGYGLDLYFKTFLELGYIGIAGLCLMMGHAIMLRKFNPVLVFALVFGLAHDPTRWPIFWFLLLQRGGAIALRQSGKNVEGHGEKNG